MDKFDTHTEDLITRELVDGKLAELTVSHKKEFNVLMTELDVEATIQKESVMSVINRMMAEEVKNNGLKCVTEVGVVGKQYSSNYGI